MEILFVSHKYPPATGGMEKQSFELINGMKRHATVHTIVYEGKGSRLSFFRTLQKKILQICAEHPGISIIHFNDGLLAAFCLMHKKYRHLQRSVTLHGLDVVYPNTLYRKFILSRFNRFSLIFTVSHATAAACIERGLDASKIVVVNNGVDAAIAGIKVNNDASLLKKYGIDRHAGKMLVMTGRPVKRKGFSWFIKHVVPGLPGDCMVLLIGPYRTKKPASSRYMMLLPRFLQNQLTQLLGLPTDEEPIRKLLAVPSISGSVKHLGRVPFDDMIGILQAADAFIMPNIRVAGDMEGFGLVCLEASLCGTPVFASRLEGITDAIHDGRNGFLLPSGDATAWTAALNNFIQTPRNMALREAFQLYTLEHFSWEKMVDGYYEHFARISRSQQADDVENI